MRLPEDHFAAELPGLDPAAADLPEAPAAEAADLPIPAPLPAWRRALDAAIATDPRGRQGVAERLEVTRAYVSRVAGGDLAARPPARFIERVHAALMQVDCPYLGRSIPPAECRAYASRSYAQVRRHEVDHWRACLKCTARAPELAPQRPPQGEAK